ncbi:hypothetical protein [Bacillus gaemokensis]|nr:hypothetical protein [Bacillus gaemokensis]
MKKTIVNLMGALTIFTLTFGVYTSVENQQIMSPVKTMADGDTGG